MTSGAITSYKTGWSLREFSKRTDSIITIAMGTSVVRAHSRSRALAKAEKEAKRTEVHGVGPSTVEYAGFKVRYCRELT